ncbi:MAG: LysM domain-containing protein [Bacillota bacterium]|nr:LysM domain-containing protein [Bacillota bacterium]
MISLVQAVLNPKAAEAYTVVGTTRVQPNGTLWSIAVEHYPNIDPREAVFHIRQVNEGIDPGRLQIGQEILLPEVE